MKIDILGWYNRQNIGDDAFQAVFSKWFAGHNPRFVTPPHFTRPYAELVILGGGAVASDYYLERIHLGSCPLIALGIDLEWEAEARKLVNSGFNLISLRDRQDVDLLRSLRPGGLLLPVDYCPDLAFALTPTGEDVLSRYRRTDKRAIAVCATDYVMPSRTRDLYHCGPRADQFCDGLGKLLDKLSEKAEIFLLPCSTGEGGNDRRVNLHIASFMQKRPTIVEDQLTPVEMIDFMAPCALTICQRFHAHVFSVIAGTPFVNIEFTKKARNLVREYQTGTARQVIGIARQPDGFFNFDHAEEVCLAALRAGSQGEEFNYASAFAGMCRKAVESLRQHVLSGYVDAVE